jgi:hypothetical protein
MALKPVFPRKPLMDQPYAWLPANRIHLKGALKAKMSAVARQLADADMPPYALSAAISAAYLIKDKDLIARCTLALDAYTGAGLHLLPPMDSLYLGNAQLKRYEVSGDKALLLPLMQLIKQLPERLDRDTLLNAGEAYELIIGLYNLTGKKQLLDLFDLLRQKAMDWTALFSTFDILKPANRLFDIEQLRKTLAAEDEPGNSLLTRRHAMIDGLSLARNLKTPVLIACVSGGAKEKEAAMIGYRRLMKSHGLPGAVFSGNPYLDGRGEGAGTDIRVAGELAHSLSKLAMSDSSALYALETLALNVLEPAIRDGAIQEAYSPNDRALYIPAVQSPERAAAILKGLTAYAQCVCAVGKVNECMLALFMDSSIRMRCQGESVRLLTSLQNDALRITVIPRNPCEGSLIVRIPPWALEARAESDGEEFACDNGICRVKRVFDAETLLTISFKRRHEQVVGYRDSVYSVHGPIIQETDR